MTDIMSKLLRKNSLRSVLRKMNIDQINKLKEDFNQIYNEIIEAENIELNKEYEKQRLIMEFRSIMIESGITTNDILEHDTVKTFSKTKGQIKYRLLSPVTGILHEWSGKGRTPQWLIEYELDGGNRNELLISD